MLDWIKSLFGKGRVRIEFEGIDKTGKIVTGDGKFPYVGLYTEEDVISHFKKELMYKHGVSVTKIEIVQHIED
jgi:tetrahydromethanopterin S-methyltransferase subunit A